MLSSFSTIFLKFNNIRSTKSKIVNINVNPLFNSLLNPSFKNLNNYIKLSNQKSFEIYSKYNTNTFPKFSVLNKNENENEIMKPNIWEKYINLPYFFIGWFYIFLASFSKNINLQVV